MDYNSRDRIRIDYKSESNQAVDMPFSEGEQFSQRIKNYTIPRWEYVLWLEEKLNELNKQP